MAQNTPMKRQFTTIDGRTVMSNLPQHWGGNDWKITGVDNPLPVGNYVQTEAGVWIPQKGSDDGAADVRVTGSIVDYINVRDLDILASTTRFFDVKLPDWCEYIVISVGKPSGGAGTLSSNSLYTWNRPGGQGPTIAFTTRELPIDYVWELNRGWISEKIQVKGSILRFSVTSEGAVDDSFSMTIATYGNVDYNNRAIITPL